MRGLAKSDDAYTKEEIRSLKKRIAELEAENARLREVSGRLLKGIEAYQYGAKPPIPLPGIASAANELEALLGGGDE